ncbi:3',5'-cyclic adenosine monophosphate phosphodiesterase CpdA [uncultured archaeon]|nr:3',5'-cyclic adenosine monophosphate phosphodiesterase CpdA [uncultured archaeon]
MKKLDYIQIIILLFVYFFMNLYVFFTFASLFNLEKNLIFYTFFSISFLSIIALTFLERSFPNPITRFFYIIAVAWSGFLLFFICLIIPYNILEIFFTIPKFIAGIVIFTLGAASSVYSLVNSLIIHTNKIQIPIKNLKKKTKIIHLSDLHLGTVNNLSYLKSVVNKAILLKPDLVVITGDLIDGTAPIKPSKLEVLNKIKVPILLILGNHEIYDLKDVYESLSKTKVKILRDETVNFRDFQIIGLDYGKERAKVIKNVLRKMPLSKTKPKILLYHTPLSPKSLSEFDIDLLLSGHLHGGQIFPIHFVAKASYPHYRGLQKKGKFHSYVSQGTGTWGPPMRFFSKNEITEIEIVPEVSLN